MQGMQALLFPLLLALAGGEVVNPSLLGFSMKRQSNHSKMAAAANTGTQEVTKIESWSPSQPELTQMLSNTAVPSAQPFMPANYYLPGNHFSPIPMNDYRSQHYINPITTNDYHSEHYTDPKPTNEYRSEHYTYPYEQNYIYPVSQPPIDTSLIPTSKHFVIVSFIGLLLLFAVIQNSIASAKRKDALVEVLSNKRKKRNSITSPGYESMTLEAESILNEDARIRCIQRTLCYENRKLLDDLGVFGKVFANYLTQSVRSSLEETSPGWDRLVEDAANAGLRGEDCNVVYRDCNLETLDDRVTSVKEEQKNAEQIRNESN